MSRVNPRANCDLGAAATTQMEAPTDASAATTIAQGTPFFSSSRQSRSAAFFTGLLEAAEFSGSRIMQQRPSPVAKASGQSPYAAAPPANFRKSLRAISEFISSHMSITTNEGLLCLLIPVRANAFDNSRHVFLSVSFLLGFAEKLFCRCGHQKVNSLAGGCSTSITKILGH